MKDPKPAPDQFRSLNTGDVLTTLRSLPRRFRQQATADPSLDLGSIANRAGHSGRSPVAVLDATAEQLRSLAQRAYRAGVMDAPASSSASSAGPSPSIDAALNRVADAATRAADELARLPSDSWGRPATGPDGQSTTVLGLAQDAARAGVDGLHALESLLRELG